MIFIHIKNTKIIFQHDLFAASYALGLQARKCNLNVISEQATLNRVDICILLPYKKQKNKTEKSLFLIRGKNYWFLAIDFFFNLGQWLRTREHRSSSGNAANEST